MNNKHLLYAIILCAAQIYAAEQPKKSLFDQLGQRAEQQYETSSDQSECSKTAAIKKEPMTYDNLTEQQHKQLRNIVVKRSIFSVSEYNCKLLLRENPLWQQVKDEMSQEDKNMLFRKLLSGYNSSESIDYTFPLACAVCAGADPDQKPKRYSEWEHYALWFACSRNHKAFFDFLVKQGADLDLSCHGVSGGRCALNRNWLIPFRWSVPIKKK